MTTTPNDTPARFTLHDMGVECFLKSNRRWAINRGPLHYCTMDGAGSDVEKAATDLCAMLNRTATDRAGLRDLVYAAVHDWRCDGSAGATDRLIDRILAHLAQPAPSNARGEFIESQLVELKRHYTVCKKSDFDGERIADDLEAILTEAPPPATKP